MGTQNHSLLTLSILATAALSACRFVTAAGAHAGVAGDALGVTRSAGAEGAYVPYDIYGTAVVEAGAAIAEGDRVQSDSTGRAIKAAATGVKSAVIAGGSAGDLTVTGITTNDRLVGVIRLNRDSTAANVNIDALTTEFTITATNTINNVGGTATTGDSLLVLYESIAPIKGRALQAASGAGKFIEILLYPN